MKLTDRKCKKTVLKKIPPLLIVISQYGGTFIH